MASLITTDPTAWMKLRKEILDRDDGKCRKCGRTDGLQAHHIIPVREDGTDDPENLCTLCEVCHREWEVFEQGTELPFDEWLTIPPFILLLTMYQLAGQKPNGTAGRLRAIVEEAHEQMLQGNRVSA